MISGFGEPVRAVEDALAAKITVSISVFAFDALIEALNSWEREERQKIALAERTQLPGWRFHVAWRNARIAEMSAWIREARPLANRARAASDPQLEMEVAR